MWKYRFYIQTWETGREKVDCTYPDITSGSGSRTELAKVSSRTRLHQVQPWAPVLEAGFKGEHRVESVWARGSRNIFLQLVMSETSPGMCHQHPTGCPQKTAKSSSLTCVSHATTSHTTLPRKTTSKQNKTNAKNHKLMLVLLLLAAVNEIKQIFVYIFYLCASVQCRKKRQLYA